MAIYILRLQPSVPNILRVYHSIFYHHGRAKLSEPTALSSCKCVYMFSYDLGAIGSMLLSRPPAAAARDVSCTWLFIGSGLAASL